MNDFISYKNTNISFSIEGKGSAIVLLHGFLENSSMWKNITKEIIKKNKVIVIDLLGHGKSDCLGYIHTMEEMATIVKAILKKEGIRKVTIIGHSMGGYVALAFAEKYPENLKGICLMNATAGSDTKERQKLRLRAIKMAQTNYRALVSMSIDNLFSNEKRLTLLAEIAIIKGIALNTKVQGYIACAEGMRIRKNREDVLTLGTFKKLMILGRKDTVLHYKSTLEEAKRTETPVESLPNGHMSYVEDPEELLLIIVAFLKKKQNKIT